MILHLKSKKKITIGLFDFPFAIEQCDCFIFWGYSSSTTVWFANIFLPLGRLPFNFVESFLCCAAFYFDVVPVIFGFVAFAFSVKSRKSLLRSISRNLSAMFSSRSFMVSGLNSTF